MSEKPERETAKLLDKVKGERRSPLRGLIPGIPKPKPVPKAGGYNFTDLMTTGWAAFGEWVEARFDPGMGRAMKFTAPVAGKVLHRSVRRVPFLYWFLGPLASGGGIRDAGAMFGIPLYVGMMERDPTLIPKTLPKVKYLAKPAITAMVEAAEKEQEDAAELAELQTRYSAAIGEPGATLDHLILVGMMGMPPDLATEILEAQSAIEIEAALARRGMTPARPGAPQPEPEREPPLEVEMTG